MAWYNSSWAKRKAITLTGGSSGAQTDYQVKLTVTYDSDMKSDFSDLRFTKADGQTLIDAWMESHTASTSAVVWVETNTPANTVEADIYMYYGNSGASSAWSGANTFNQYYAGGTVTNTNVLYPDNTKQFATANYAVRTRAKISSTSGQYARMAVMASGTSTAIENPYIALAHRSTPRFELRDYNATGIDVFSSPSSDTAYHEIDFYGTTSSMNGRMDDSEVQIQTVGIPTNFYLAYRVDNAGAAQTITIDWGLVRKYAANPATYVFGAEESESGVIPVIMRYYRNMRNN